MKKLITRFGLPLVVAAVIAVVLIGGGLLLVGGGYVYYRGLKSEAVSRETTLSTQYLSNQNFLSTYISGFYEQLGVANLKSEKLETLMVDAVKGRYENEGGYGAQGAFFKAVVEAYPDAKQLAIYDKIVDYVAAQREGYRAIQDKLLDMLRAYDFWRNDGVIQPWILESFVGVPTTNLKARIGEEILTGNEALKKMYVIVLASDAKKAYQSGTLEPLNVPSGKPPASSAPTAVPKK